jgi:methylthioribose-1-phosphate isomerase
MSKRNNGESVQTVGWVGDATSGFLRLIDQTRLPTEYIELDCRDLPTVWQAIKLLRVRGAPAIGVAAAYGAVIGARAQGWNDAATVKSALREATAYLRTSRPTAVNLFWALDRMDAVAAAAESRGDGKSLLDRLLSEARQIEEEDRATCRAIGRHGAALVEPGQGILTHCNAGGLATADYGTALAVIFAAAERGIWLSVFADETRPLLQGARLTAWELKRRNIPVTLICDSMAAQVMREGKVQLVIVGADRIAANGDTANKIGTYGLALLAKAHGIPFYVAAPKSTFDLSIADGSAITIEQRDPKEVTHGFGRQTAPDGIEVYNPAFDVTPAELISGIVTEAGIIRPVERQTIVKILSSK